MSLCVIAAGKTAVLAASVFTLSWSHSVEKTRWEEDWRLTSAGLQIIEARVKGSGAGMEPPDGAMLEDGWWAYRPDLPPQQSLLLAASGATGSGWSLCAEGDCLTIGAKPGAPVEVRPCSSGDQ